VTSRVKNIWRPWNFHYHRFLVRPNDCFEGWYFKIVDASGEHPYAFIPGVFMGTAFRGFLVGMLLDGTLHRFTTYNGGFIESLNLTATHLKIKIRNRTHRLQISSEKTSGALLMAP